MSCIFTHNVHKKRENTGIPATHNTNHSKSIHAYRLSMGGISLFFHDSGFAHIMYFTREKHRLYERRLWEDVFCVHKHEVKFTRSIALFPVSFIKSKF